MSTTLRPAFAAVYAAIDPAGPAPTIKTSISNVFRITIFYF
jgi:hypothetical protein